MSPETTQYARRSRDDDSTLALNRTVLRSISDTIAKFRNISHTMPVGEVQIFILVALNEGASLNELAELADMKKSTASRYLLDLSDKVRTGEEGYGLVSREQDPHELRKNMYSLTAKGRRMVADLLQGAQRG